MENQSSNRFSLQNHGLQIPGLYTVLLILLGLVVLIQAIRLIWLLVTPLGPVGDWRSEAAQVMPFSARQSLFQRFDPFYRNEVAASSNVVTSLQLTLYGVRMNEGSGLGSAILAGSDGVQESFAIGDEIQSGVTLHSVAFDHVVIDRDGTRESLYLDQSVPAETVGTAAPVPAVETGGAPSATNALPTAAAVASAIALAPRAEDGEVTGIVLQQKGDGSLIEAAGFRDGDIIVSVNGRDVTSAADIEALKSKIIPGARLSVEVERGADRVPLAINVGAD